MHKGSLNIDELAELRQENLELRDQLIRLKENGANGGNWGVWSSPTLDS